MNDHVIDRAIPPSPDDVLARARELRRQLSGNFREEAVKSLYAEAERVAQRAVSQGADTRALDFDQRVDHLVTSPWLGLPIMLVLLAVVFWRSSPTARWLRQSSARTPRTAVRA